MGRLIDKRRKQVCLDCELSSHDAFCVIDRQHRNRGSADFRYPFENRTMPVEMVGPAIHPRVEQSYELMGSWIDAGEIGALVRIARSTCDTEVRFNRLSSVLL
jgi:hypothetical protein